MTSIGKSENTSRKGSKERPEKFSLVNKFTCKCSLPFNSLPLNYTKNETLKPNRLSMLPPA